jgi:hypothetical protein
VLHEWEHWAAELLETHLSYPMLAYFRSQHSNESWIAALTTILDASALLIAGGQGAIARQARADLRHRASRRGGPGPGLQHASERKPTDRLPAEVLARLRAELDAAGCALA